MNIFPIIVTYCTDYHSTAVYQNLIRFYPDCQLLIYDNSPTSINKKYGNENQKYIHDATNGGVTAAYNAGASIAKEMGKSHIVLFDQDTIFNKDYLNILEADIRQHPDINLMVPAILYGKQKPFSPVRMTFLSIQPVCLGVGEYSLRDYLPVNSGACINLSAFEQVDGYNERIKLDFADFDFFQRLIPVSHKFLIVDSVAFQQFSNQETDIEKLMNRFRLYIADARNYQGRRSIAFHVLRHTIALSIRCRSIRFITYYIRHYLSSKPATAI